MAHSTQGTRKKDGIHYQWGNTIAFLSSDELIFIFDMRVGGVAIKVLSLGVKREHLKSARKIVIKKERYSLLRLIESAVILLECLSYVYSTPTDAAVVAAAVPTATVRINIVLSYIPECCYSM
jgi:hypothetical protein